MSRTRSYLSTEDHVLEVGCGTGSTALLLAPHVKHLLATDTSKRMIEIGQEKAGRSDVANLTLDQRALPDPDLEADKFDKVLCFNTLHLVPDLDAVLVNLHKSLTVVCSFPKRSVWQSEQDLGCLIFLLRMIGKAPYVNLLTFQDVQTAIANAGFEVVETGVYPAPFSYTVVGRKADNASLEGGFPGDSKTRVGYLSPPVQDGQDTRFSNSRATASAPGSLWP